MPRRHGHLVSPYDGKTLSSASQVDAGHMVPLANAWRSGAGTWDTPKRKAFANDLQGPQLLAVAAASNRSKGDQSPDQWAPSSRAFWCAYTRAWTHIKHTYQLTPRRRPQRGRAGRLRPSAAAWPRVPPRRDPCWSSQPVGGHVPGRRPQAHPSREPSREPTSSAWPGAGISLLGRTKKQVFQPDLPTTT